MAESLQPELEGELLLCYKGALRKKSKEYNVRLYALSRSGLARLELYETRKKSSHGLLIVGSEIVKVERTARHHWEEESYFTVTTKEQQYTFMGASADDCDLWVQKIEDTLLHSGNPGPCEQTAMLENDIYASVEEESREFLVEANRKTGIKLAVQGRLRLLVNHGNITIITSDGVRIARWPVEQLRKIGYTEKDFHVMTGRNCEHGSDVFYFQTNQGMKIWKVINKEKSLIRSLGTKNCATPLLLSQTSPVLVPPTHSYDYDYHIYDEIIINNPEVSEDLQKFQENSLSGGEEGSSSLPIIPDSQAQESLFGPAKPHTAGISKTLPNSRLGQIAPTKNTKSQSSNAVSSGRKINSLEARPILPPCSQRRNSVPHQLTEAWKHGHVGALGYSDVGNQEYDKLSHLPAMEDLENPYNKLGLDGCQQESSETSDHQMRNEPIYATVDLTKKVSRKEH